MGGDIKLATRDLNRGGRGSSRNSDMTVEEAGRKGGETVARKYGHEHFEEIGRKGGEAVSDKYGHEHFEEIGHKGGQKVRDLIEKGKQSGSNR